MLSSKYRKRVSERHKRVTRSIAFIVPVCLVLSGCASSKGGSAGGRTGEYNNTPKAEYLQIDLDYCNGSVVVTPGGNVVLSEQDSYDVLDAADNGVLAVQDYNGSEEVLAIIKDGETIQVSDVNNNGILCGSGKKLFYKDYESGTIYSYDVESGENAEIYKDAEIEYVSYDGNVICLSDGFVKVGSSEPVMRYPFTTYIGASDSGEQVYFNSYHSVEEYNVDMELTSSQSVCDFGVLNAKDSNVSNNIISTESSEAAITAHNSDFSEILYRYDGDTYFFSADKKDKQLVTSRTALIPVEEVYEYNNSALKSVFDPYEYYEKSFVNIPPEYYKFKHSVASIKDHIYCAFDYNNCRADLVYLDNELKTQTLVDNISALPVVAGGGSYIWTASGNTIYRIDLTDKAPSLLSCEIDGLGYPVYEEGTYISLPIAVMDDGKTAYCIGETSLNYDLNRVSGTLYYVDFDNAAETAAEVETGVTSCAADNSAVYYTITSEEYDFLSKLYCCSPDGKKDRITSDVWVYFVVNSRLYMLKVDGNYDQQDYKINLYEFNDGLHMIAEDVYEDLISIGY